MRKRDAGLTSLTDDVTEYCGGEGGGGGKNKQVKGKAVRRKCIMGKEMGGGGGECRGEGGG